MKTEIYALLKKKTFKKNSLKHLITCSTEL